MIILDLYSNVRWFDHRRFKRLLVELNINISRNQSPVPSNLGLENIICLKIYGKAEPS